MDKDLFNLTKADKADVERLEKEYSMSRDQVIRWVLLDLYDERTQKSCRQCVKNSGKELAVLKAKNEEERKKLSKFSPDQKLPASFVKESEALFSYTSKRITAIDDDINAHVAKFKKVHTDYKHFLTSHHLIKQSKEDDHA